MERWSGVLDWITGVPRPQIYHLLEATPTNVQLALSAMARNSSSTLKRLARATKSPHQYPSSSFWHE